RFTLAHECGHFLLHKREIAKEVHVDKAFPMLMRDSMSAMGISEMEMEANLFAAELLMPAALISEELESNPIDIDEEDAIDELARRFKVSQSAMRFRLGNLLAWN
ncbi:MAG: ImmA/IrrE family metallo-endopeptidase, partial [Candidatus Poribacteria bacterium]|nr:ImmA/IrrE family metallo-endopeptidase [Candidatus Poribacteria bacterium]